MSNNLKIVSVIAILKHRNKFLVVQRAKNDSIFPGKWQNVGGKVEENERIETAIFREINEEIGIKLDKSIKLNFVMSYSWVKDTDEPVRLGLVFLINLRSKPTDIKISEELENYGWYTFQEIQKLDTIGQTSQTGTIKQIQAVINKVTKSPSKSASL